MTDTPSSLLPQSPQQTAPTASLVASSHQPNGSLADIVMQDDNEDYTIKCICSYGDDDGSTVYCDKCDTWQHIICYYQGKKVPDVHCCADCDPRQLDSKKAAEAQKRLRDQVDHPERKAKRPPPRNHKKKKDSTTTVEQVNGVHSHGQRESVSATHDQPPPAKRPKTSHRASNSAASLNGVAAAQPESRKRASSNLYSHPSPLKSPPSQPLHPRIPMYSPDFLNLYKNDRGKNKIRDTDEVNMFSNSMSMAVTNDLTTWYDDPSTLQQATGSGHDEVFHQSEKPLLPQTWPQVHLQEKRDATINYNGQVPMWKCVVLETSVKKDDFIGEIKGDISRLEDYCRDADSRWNELRHPEPFVFFHPQVPICIDSRAEGTQFRYVRRSCHPNVSLRTFVTGERDFHHCFVAKENIPAGTELTVMWYIDQTLVSNGKAKEENEDEEEPRRRKNTYFSRILSNFGGCACDSTACLLKQFDLRASLEPLKRRNDSRKGRNKVKSAASPSNTDHVLNSRAGSENPHPSDEEDLAETRSTSGSVRSKPQSRDITPATLSHVDPRDELSQREKKKIQMVEKAFEEQQSKRQKPKRKRASGGATVNTCPPKNVSPVVTSLPVTPSQTIRPPELNVATGHGHVGPPPRSAPLRRNSNLSPHKSSTPNTPSPLFQSSRKVYVDQAMQTEPELDVAEALEATPPLTVPCLKRYEHPHIRRIRRYQEWERKDKIKKEEMNHKIHAGLCPSSSSIVPSWLEERRLAQQRSVQRCQQDTASTREFEAEIPLQPPTSHVRHSNRLAEVSKSEAPPLTVQLPPPPLPSQVAHTHHPKRASSGPKLQLSTVPPVPAFIQPHSSATPLGPTTSFSTPTDPSIPPSPYSNHTMPPQSQSGMVAGVIAPSPVKKKLSLGDYMSRRSNLNTPITEKPPAPGVGAQSTGRVFPLHSQGPVIETDAVPPPPSTKLDHSVKVDPERSQSSAPDSGIPDGPLVKSEHRGSGSFAPSLAVPSAPQVASSTRVDAPPPETSLALELEQVHANLQVLASDAAPSASARSAS